MLDSVLAALLLSLLLGLLWLPRPLNWQQLSASARRLRWTWALLAALLSGAALYIDGSLTEHWVWPLLFAEVYWSITHSWLQRRLASARIDEVGVHNTQPRLFGRSTLTLADGRRLYCDYRTTRTPPASVQLAQAHNRYGSWYWRVDALGNRIG